MRRLKRLFRIVTKSKGFVIEPMGYAGKIINIDYNVLRHKSFRFIKYQRKKGRQPKLP